MREGREGCVRGNLRGLGGDVVNLKMQQEDFKRIKKSIGKVPPQKLGKMLRDYHNKYLKGQRAETYSEALKIFDGGIL